MPQTLWASFPTLHGKANRMAERVTGTVWLCHRMTQLRTVHAVGTDSPASQALAKAGFLLTQNLTPARWLSSLAPPPEQLEVSDADMTLTTSAGGRGGGTGPPGERT